jgi:hypothetical protein
VQDALLLTSELVTNAVTHTDGGSELHASYDPMGGRVRVEVADTSSIVPTIRKTDGSSSLGGRGLRVIDTVATRWGTILLPTGKSVWFELGERPSRVESTSTTR